VLCDGCSRGGSGIELCFGMVLSYLNPSNFDSILKVDLFDITQAKILYLKTYCNIYQLFNYQPTFFWLLATMGVLLISLLVYSLIFPYSLDVSFERKIMTDQIMTLKEVAEYLKLTENTAYRLVAERKLPGFKVGGSWRFKREDLEAWIDNKKEKE
jgi:excisionase family DNA binding protein